MQTKTKRLKKSTYLFWFFTCILFAASFYLVASIWAYAAPGANPEHGFRAFAVMRMRPPFADLRYIFANAECGVDLSRYYAGLANGCDPAGRIYPFDYPPMSIWVSRLLNIKGASTPIIATASNLSLMASTIFIIYSTIGLRWLSPALSSLMLLGWPYQLAMERGNLDVILYLMTLVYSFLPSRKVNSINIKAMAGLASGLISFLLVALKLYPVFGLIGLFTQKLNTDKALWSYRFQKLIVLFSIVLGLVSLTSFLQSIGNIPKYGGMGSHGLLAFGYINNELINHFGLGLARYLIKSLFLFKAVSILAGYVIALRLNFINNFQCLCSTFQENSPLSLLFLPSHAH
jgi:hypothetical protein